MNKYKKLILAFGTLLIAVTATAQNQQTPYSRYGHGVLGDYATSMQRNMGGVGIAMTGGRQINVMNPASYAGIDSLTLLWDIGVDLTQIKSKETVGGVTSKGKAFGGGLDYLTLQFPISKFMGGSIGLVPYSSVGYSFGGDLKDNNGDVNGSSSFVGEGGINELYIGVAGRLFKGFNLGANFAYQFGTTKNDTYAYGTDGASALFEQTMEIRDWNMSLGAQYTMDFHQKHRVTLGATFSPKKDFHGKTWGISYDVNQSSSSTEAPDTLAYTKLNGGYTKPNSFGAGVSYTFKNKLTVESDFTLQQWSKARYDGLKDSKGNIVSNPCTFDDRWKFATGVQYVPQTRGAYFKRVAYRCGGFFTHDYMMVPDAAGALHNVCEYGVAAGFGLPTAGTKTIINLGFEFRHRSAKSAPNLVSENYFNITLGVNFNEFAFWQNKIK